MVLIRHSHTGELPPKTKPLVYTLLTPLKFFIRGWKNSIIPAQYRTRELFHPNDKFIKVNLAFRTANSIRAAHHA